MARVDIEGATRTGAGGAPRVMLIAADVVARLLGSLGLEFKAYINCKA